jgi:glycosyltransferase involved in cell wall biosynthesis
MISAIILAKNEEKNIKDCLQSISWCDEKIVIDDNSTDKTSELAKKYGAKVYKKHLSNFSEQRNYAIEKATGDWILFIDADERVSSALWYEIMQHINEPIEKTVGFYIKRIDIMWGRELKHGDSGEIKLLRLAKKNSGQWRGIVHERWEIRGKTATLNNPLYHYPHKSVAEFLKEINHYTDLRAKELFEQKKKANWVSVIIYPKAKFVLSYFYKLGFLDGLPGLIHALMMSFHSYLVRGKLWLLWQKHEK